MADLTPTPRWDNVTQLETFTRALAGVGGPMNAQAQALLNRTAFLDVMFDDLAVNNDSAKGAAMVGYDGGTAQIVLDSGGKTMENYTALRAYTGRATAVRITAQGLAGLFQRDDADMVTADNGGTVVVDASGRRWKRVFVGGVWANWFGTVANGNTDDRAAIDAAIAAARLGNFVVYLPQGVYALASPITMYMGVQLIGVGATSGVRLKSKDGVPATALVRTENFLTLRGTNTPQGPYKWRLQNITLDGNRFNVTAPVSTLYGLFEIYGYDYDVKDVLIQDSIGDGFFSEWAASAGVPVVAGGDGMEARISNLKVFRCQLTNFRFRGPHDSVISDLFLFLGGRSNGSIGDLAGVYSAGGVHLTNVHSYYSGAETADVGVAGLYIDTIATISNMQVETAQKGPNLQFGPISRVVASNVRSFLCQSNIAANGGGIWIQSSGNMFTGVRCEDNVGVGIFLSGSDNTVNASVTTSTLQGLSITGNNNVIKLMTRSYGNTGANVSDTGAGNT